MTHSVVRSSLLTAVALLLSAVALGCGGIRMEPDDPYAQGGGGSFRIVSSTDDEEEEDESSEPTSEPDPGSTETATAERSESTQPITPEPTLDAPQVPRAFVTSAVETQQAPRVPELGPPDRGGVIPEPVQPSLVWNAEQVRARVAEGMQTPGGCFDAYFESRGLRTGALRYRVGIRDGDIIAIGELDVFDVVLSLCVQSVLHRLRFEGVGPESTRYFDVTIELRQDD